MSTTPTQQKKPPLRRRVRQEQRIGDQVLFKTKSFTKNDNTIWHPTIDVSNGHYHCDCPAYHFNTREPCKHCVRAALQLIAKGELDAAWLYRAGKTVCHKCGADSNLFEMCQDDGTPIPDVHICGSCAKPQNTTKPGCCPHCSERLADSNITQHVGCWIICPSCKSDILIPQKWADDVFSRRRVR